MSFDGTVHLGDLITLVVIGSALLGKMMLDRQNFAELKTKVDILFTWFSKHVLNGTDKGD